MVERLTTQQSTHAVAAVHVQVAKPRQQVAQVVREKQVPSLLPSAVTVIDAYDRLDHVKQRIQNSVDSGEKPVVALFNDAAERYEPASMPDVTFIDVAGGTSNARNVQFVSSPAFLELVHARILKAIQAGCRHVVIDDAQAIRFYNGDGPSHAFFHSLAAAMMLRDVSCDVILPEGPEAHSFAKALRTWIG